MATNTKEKAGIAEVYYGFERLLVDAFPKWLLKSGGGAIFQNKGIYMVGVKTPKLKVSGRVYGTCICEVRKVVGDGKENEKLGDIPFGLVVDDGDALHGHINEVLTKSASSEIMGQELQGLWYKVLHDRIKVLEKNEGDFRIVSVDYQPPKNEDEVLVEFKKQSYLALSRFYMGLIMKLDGAKGKFLVQVQDVTLTHSGKYLMNIVTSVKAADKDKVVTVKFALPIDYDYYDKKLMKKLDRSVKDRVMQFTESQKKPFEFDGVWISMTRYNGIHSGLRWLLSDNAKETAKMMERIKTVIHSDEVKDVIGAVRGYHKELVQIQVKPLKGAKTNLPLYLGTNGISSGEVGVKIYNRRDGETNLMGALKMLIALYGESDAWFKILNCFDLRKRVD
ncbi:hypothetical protein FT641_19820 [Bacillus paranthracis]|uniref:hypothetical protein n=1 Tax=Bacillus paranthracis TaxID=2026186 RepID=UPI0018791B39|nr:hypothetical protein [Bacillus paranthracis]MBE7114690.1 hypothetical protein [Bacillus paranthracis]MBE7154943.1 hypothetical protein [Bacillus paranthracis]